MHLNDERIPPRIWEKIAVDADGCWIWNGTYASAPQTRWKVDGVFKCMNVRRVFHLVEFGPPPHDSFGGCKRLCVNPAHIKNLPSSQLSAMIAAAKREKRTHCPHGHELAVVGVYVYTRPGVPTHKRKYQTCRACHAEQVAERRRKRQDRRAKRMKPERRERFMKRREITRAMHARRKAATS